MLCVPCNAEIHRDQDTGSGPGGSVAHKDCADLLSGDPDCYLCRGRWPLNIYSTSDGVKHPVHAHCIRRIIAIKIS